MSAYHDDELDPDTRQDVLAHIETCDDCARALAALGELDEGLAAAPVPPLADACRARVEEAVGASLPGYRPASPPPLPQPWGWRRLVATVCIGVAIAGFSMGGLGFWTVPEPAPVPGTESREVDDETAQSLALRGRLSRLFRNTHFSGNPQFGLQGSLQALVDECWWRWERLEAEHPRDTLDPSRVRRRESLEQALRERMERVHTMHGVRRSR